MKRHKSRLAIVSLAVAITISSLAIAKLGQPYYCSHGQKYPELHRDERGIPFSFIKRSVQGTGCAPKDLNNRPLTNKEQDHSIYPFIFILDIAFGTY